jgi:hypothetical protein
MEGLRMAKRFAIYQEKYRGLLVDQANADDSKKVNKVSISPTFFEQLLRS